jgi:hypothetical protein
MVGDYFFCFSYGQFKFSTFFMFKSATNKQREKKNSVDFSIHQQWDCGRGWKNTLNNLRLILQPTLVLWLIFPWLEVFPNSQLLLGFNHLISEINQYQPFYSSG